MAGTFTDNVMMRLVSATRTPFDTTHCGIAIHKGECIGCVTVLTVGPGCLTLPSWSVQLSMTLKQSSSPWSSLIPPFHPFVC